MNNHKNTQILTTYNHKNTQILTIYYKYTVYLQLAKDIYPDTICEAWLMTHKYNRLLTLSLVFKI